MTKNSQRHRILLPSGGVLIIEPLRKFSQQESAELLKLNKLSTEISQKRANETLTWRCMVREELHDESLILSYNYVGAPQIDDSHLHLSVSHTSHLVAVLISPIHCAVDIEELDRNFTKVAPKFCSANEPNTPEALPYLWCAKESLYKYAAHKELSLLDDIKVTQITPNRDSFTATITTTSNTTVSGSLLTLNSHAVAYIG